MRSTVAVEPVTSIVREPDFHYTWATRLRPHELLHECTPYNSSGGFRAPVEVIVFPNAKGTAGFSVLSSREYLAKGADLDKGAAAVRFNADTTDPFSVIWEPDGVAGAPQAVGRVHVIGPVGVTSIMREMIERSATPQVAQHPEAVVRRGVELNGSDVSSVLRPALSEAGLVKSVSIPPGRLRLVSRLEKELLSPGATLTHEVVIAATVPEAVNKAAGLECEIAVFPKGWINLASDSKRLSEDVIERRVPENWGRPQDGRTGAGSRYVFESLVSRSSVLLASTPPVSRRPPSGQRGAEVRVRLTRRGVEVCRLHHPFWIEQPQRTANAQSGPSAFAEEVQHILDLALLSDADVARATGAPVTTVRGWLNDVREPTGEETGRVNELSAIVDRLAGVMTPDFIALWLRKPLHVLDDEKPVDVLARGDYTKVSRVIAALESPVAS